MQKPNYKALIVKYLCNVLIFAGVYALVAYPMILAGVTGIALSLAPISAAALSVLILMRRIGPWIDKRMDK